MEKHKTEIQEAKRQIKRAKELLVDPGTSSSLVLTKAIETCLSIWEDRLKSLTKLDVKKIPVVAVTNDPLAGKSIQELESLAFDIRTPEEIAEMAFKRLTSLRSEKF